MNWMYSKMNNKKGFTLIELIVVIAIIGILAAITIPRFSGIQDSAAKKTVLADAKTIATTIEVYKADTGNWPTTANIIAYLGKTPGGVIAPDPITDGSFTYTATANGKTWVATCTAGGAITVAEDVD